jgi:heptose I phosphotransferase
MRGHCVAEHDVSARGEVLWLRDDLRVPFAGLDVAAIADRLQGEVFRQVAGRRTVRLVLDGRAYFAKVHEGVGWREVLKNWLTLKPAVTGAQNEYRACLHLEAVGIRAPTVAGFGADGAHLAARRSWVVCDELAGYQSLEDVVAGWSQTPPSETARRALLDGVARFVARLHGAGVVHRDLYICHLLIDTAAWATGQVELAVLDLHRAQLHARIPRRWLLRDLAALLYSSLDLGLDARAWLRFVRLYRGRPLAEVVAAEGDFWRAVHARAERLYRKGAARGLVTGRWSG